MIPSLPVFRARKRPLVSGLGASLGKGPSRRDRSPPGGSTLTTRAPRSAKRRAQKGCGYSLAQVNDIKTG